MTIETISVQPAGHFLAGGGEMGARMRATDWSKTPIGPVESWSPTLRTIVSFLLANRFPLLLWWGPQYTQIYNDAYSPIPGAKHPNSLGQPASECWREIWHIIGPLIDSPFGGGPATWMEDIELEIQRAGFFEETHFTIAYSPVPDETASRGIGGVLATVHEITEKVINERRVVILRDLGARAAEAKTAGEACAIAVAALAHHAKDIPFALLYLIDPNGALARLAGAVGINPGEAAAPLIVALDAFSSQGAWPLAEAVSGEEVVLVDNLAAHFDRVPQGPWSDSPRSALVIPMRSNKAHQFAGLLVAGVSPRLRLDDLYRSFFDLVAAQIAAAVANARAYEEERKRAEALAEIDRAKTVFFSNVSHEFRTPLTLMLGPLEEALAGPAEALPKRREDLALVHRSSVRLLRLVNTLLDFSRIEADRVQASYEPVDLPAFTAELASVFRAATDKAGLQLTVDCPPLAQPVWVDREMWEKIVLNLVSNAFKFTFEGGVTVRLRQQDGSAVLEVEDTGIGIPGHEIPRLFDRFHRVEGARGRTHEGTGIGLALVQALVKLHSGAVRADSVLGQGSTFTVAIPLGMAHLPSDRLQAARTLVTTALGARPYVEEALRWLPDNVPEEVEREILPERAVAVEVASERATVLLAEDNADMRDYVRRLLAPRYEVQTVSDGVAALAAMREHRPDLLLSDVMMPRLDGFGLVRQVRADPALADLPIILLSARAGEEASVEGLEAGADDYLIKPFSARELLARVGANLDMARLRREAEQRLAADLQAMTRLREVGERCIRAGSEFDLCLEDILDAAIAITKADKGLIQLLDAGSGTLEIAAQRGFEKPFLDFFTHIGEAEASACSAALQSADRVIVEDVAQSEIFAGQPSLEIMLEAGVRAVQSTPLINGAGSIFGIISTQFNLPHLPSERELRLMDLLAQQASDYLERKKAETAAQALSAELQQILDTSATGLTHCSRDMRYVSANPAFARVAGVPLERITGRPIAEVMGEKAFGAIRPYIERALNGERVEFEIELPWAARGPKWTHCVYTPCRQSGGSISGWVGSVRDVTERRRSQAKLLGQRRILELVATGAPLIDTLDELMLFIESQEAGMICGLLLTDDGVHFRPGSGPNIPLNYKLALHEAIKTIPITTPYFVTCAEAAHRDCIALVSDVAKDEKYAQPWRDLMLASGLHAVRSTPVRASDGHVLGCLALYFCEPRDPNPDDLDLIDIATHLAAIAIERKQVDEAVRHLNLTLEQRVEERSRALKAEMAERRKAEAMLQQAQRLEAIGQLTGGVAHDFNNLLTVILGNIDLLQSGSRAADDPSRLIDAMQSAAEHGAQLTSQLLAFSRHQQLQPVTVSVQRTLLGVEDLVRGAVSEAVTVEISADPAAWPSRLDPARFESAILNLAVNARDAMAEGGRLAITSRNVTVGDFEAARLDVAPGDYVRVAVTDSGAGMAADVLRRAFEPFFTTKDIGKGTGLGLAQVYGFAKQSGGTATIDSTVGIGTTVALYLPRADTGGTEEQPLAREREPVGGHGKTILVVEDQPELLRLIGMFLDGLDYRILTAADGVAARKLLETDEKVDLLLTDAVMPNGVSGLDLARHARRLRQDLKIVMMSGYVRDPASRADALPNMVFLEKPFRRAKLAETISVALYGSGG